MHPLCLLILSSNLFHPTPTSPSPGKLVKKSDQCRAILAAAALFITNPDSADSSESSNSSASVGTLEPEILKCFRKCVKISSSLLDSALQLQLYVEILSHLTLYVKYQNSDITELIRQLVGQITDRRQEAALPELMAAQYANTLTFLQKSGLEVPVLDGWWFTKDGSWSGLGSLTRLGPFVVDVVRFVAHAPQALWRTLLFCWICSSLLLSLSHTPLPSLLFLSYRLIFIDDELSNLYISFSLSLSLSLFITCIVLYVYIYLIYQTQQSLSMHIFFEIFWWWTEFLFWIDQPLYSTFAIESLFPISDFWIVNSVNSRSSIRFCRFCYYWYWYDEEFFYILGLKFSFSILSFLLEISVTLVFVVFCF